MKGGKHVDTEVLKILVNAIQSNLKDSYGRPCLSFKKATKELFGRLTAENIGNAKLWEMYSDLVSSIENKDNSNEEDLYKAAAYMQKATSSFMQSNKDWYKTASDVLSGLLLSIKYAKCKYRHILITYDAPKSKLMRLNVSSIVYIFIFSSGCIEVSTIAVNKSQSVQQMSSAKMTIKSMISKIKVIIFVTA